MLDLNEDERIAVPVGLIVGPMVGLALWIALGWMGWVVWTATSSRPVEVWCGTPSHVSGRSGARTVFACESAPAIGSRHD